ncbi:transketolase [Candidatus Cetobacterium colombiensis]|uniref:Transketolase n=1 Tax=Candidatus Cetobacterium colombiensis TaxID=3073100 RepID=A0ABU4W8Y0_9FUSO|nr:transketolase [Candidatus Cetobacterium colombiensis]MDX8335972.1 transketolase [Candidatus Cetobacterium colombiensis]
MTNVIEMQNFAKDIRKETLKIFLNRGFGHIGGALSIIETLAVLYSTMKINPENPKDLNRDFFILSKGHASPSLYAALALKGFFPKDWLYTLNDNGTNLPSHPNRNLTPGIDMSTGSLGQGISAAVGVALGLKRDNSERKVYCIVGDGELNEGQCWEAIQFAAHFKLTNFTLFIDNNKKQLDGPNDEICETFSFLEKLRSFGFHSIQVKGNSVEEIYSAIKANNFEKPKAIVLDTVKGQGVKYFEDLKDNHHVKFNDEMKGVLLWEIQNFESEGDDDINE